MNNLIFIGCPRSGTKYTSVLFSKNGLDIGHEKYGANGISSWCITTGDKNFLWGPSFIDVLNKYESARIYHQVRNPIDTIGSMLTLMNESFEYASKFTNISLNNTKLVNCMLFWLEWNLLAEKITSDNFKVEEILNKFPELKVTVGKRQNSRKHLKLTKKDLKEANAALCSKIEIKAKEYGYTI